MNTTYARRRHNLRGVAATNRHMDMRRRRREANRKTREVWPFRRPPVIEEILDRIERLWAADLLP